MPDPDLTVESHAHPTDRVTHARARLSSADDAARLTSLLSLMADPAAMPNTVVLDARHRVAAVKIGWTTATTIVTMVAQVTGRQAPA